jgi:hypothetical protein
MICCLELLATSAETEERSKAEADSRWFVAHVPGVVRRLKTFGGVLVGFARDSRQVPLLLGSQQSDIFLITNSHSASSERRQPTLIDKVDPVPAHQW